MQQEKEQVFLSSSTTAINSMITFDSAQKADEQAKLTKLAYRSTINFLELVKARISWTTTHVQRKKEMEFTTEIERSKE